MLELFVNPFLLGGLALTAAPVIIHLLNRRRYRVHDWAAMDFLLAAQSSNRRRLRLEDLLLLLLRMLVIAALVLVVARPIVRGLAGWREDRRVVVLDDSFSMEAAGATGPVFTVAQDGATDQIQDAIGGGTAVSLWLGSRPGEEAGRTEGAIRGGVLADEQRAEDPAVAAALAGRGILEQVRAAKTTDLPLRFADVVRSVTEEARQDPAPTVRSIVLVSDFRSVDWVDGDSLDDGVAAALEELVDSELEDRIRFQLVDVGAESIPNLAVTDCEVVDQPALSGVPVRIAVEVTNFADAPAPRVEGVLEIGKPDASGFEAIRSIPLPLVTDLAAGESARVEVRHVFDVAGQFPMRARIDADRLGRDDEGHGVAVVRDSLRVVVVDGAPAAERFARDSAYVLAALAPRGEVPSGLETRRLDGEIGAEDLRDADVVLVLNRVSLSPGERDVLTRFVLDGGGIGYFLGDRVDADAYRALGELAVEETDRVPLFPAALGELQVTGEGAEPVNLRVLDYEHPAFALFRGLASPSLEVVLFSRFFRLAPLPGAAVIASYTDAAETPAILEMVVRPPGAEAEEAGGRIALFNTTADRDWGDWPTDPSYVIVLQEWARHLAGRRGGGRVLEAGGALDVRIEAGLDYRLVSVDGEEVKPEDAPDASLEGDSRGLSTRALRFRPLAGGLHRLVVTPKPGVVVEPVAGDASRVASGPRVEWFAWQRPRAESDLEALGPEKLRELLEPTGVDFAIGKNVEVDAFRKRQEGEMWRWLALATGLLLLTELLVAWWIGRR